MAYISNLWRCVTSVFAKLSKKHFSQKNYDYSRDELSKPKDYFSFYFYEEARCNGPAPVAGFQGRASTMASKKK
jgi:hypothetical protein